MDDLVHDIKNYALGYFELHETSYLSLYFQIYHPSISQREKQRIQSLRQLLVPRAFISLLALSGIHLMIFLLTYIMMTMTTSYLTPILDEISWIDPYLSRVFAGCLTMSYLINYGPSCYHEMSNKVRWMNSWILYLCGCKYLVERLPLILTTTMMRKILPISVNLFPLIDR